jgi:hypothetical protein
MDETPGSDQGHEEDASSAAQEIQHPFLCVTGRFIANYDQLLLEGWLANYI